MQRLGCRYVSFTLIDEMPLVATKTAKKRVGKKRELVKPVGDARYIRRDDKGEFQKVMAVGRSLAADRRSKSTRLRSLTKVTRGTEDR